MHTYKSITIMKTFLGLFIAMICLSGVQSAEQLTQSDAAVIKPGNSHTLTCTASGFTFSSYAMSWVREIRGKLQWIAYISYNGGTIHYHDDVKGRFTISRDNSNNMLQLKMDNMKTEDTATYYCARHSGSYGYAMDVWGPGTSVAVTAAGISPPLVYPLLPCYENDSLKEVTIGCLSTGYFPAPVDVTWNSGAITTGIRNLPGVFSANGNYISTSLLTISVSDSKSNKYTCDVDHKATSTKINKEIPVKSSSLTVEIMQSSCGINDFVGLVCFISGHSPEDIKIKWFQNGKQTTIIPTNSNQGKFISSKLSVPKDDWYSGEIYSCKVTHSPSSAIYEKTISKCSETSTFHPKIVLLPASKKDLLITKEPKVTCVVSRLKTTESLNIKWKRSDGKKAEGVTSTPTRNVNGTYTVKSTLNISKDDWDAAVSFNCIIDHSDLPSTIERLIKKRDNPREPTIYILPPPLAEFHNNDMVGVICLLKGFNEVDVYVEWRKNNVTIGEDQYENTEPILSHDNETYSMFSRVLVYKSDWNRGATFTCRGGLTRISSRDINKHNGKNGK